MDYHRLAEEYLDVLNHRPRTPKHKENGTIHGEMAVLCFLREIHNPASPSELSNDRQLSTARIANTLASLEKKGWIRREHDSEDRRKVLVYLTDAGMERAEKGHQDCLNHMEEMFLWLGEEDSREFVRIQRRLNEFMKVKSEK